MIQVKFHVETEQWMRDVADALETEHLIATGNEDEAAQCIARHVPPALAERIAPDTEHVGDDTDACTCASPSYPLLNCLNCGKPAAL